MEILVLLISNIIMGALTLLAWQRRKTPVGLAFFALMLCAFIWVAGDLIEIQQAGIEQRIFWANIEFLGITFLPLMQIYLVLVYSGRSPSPKLLGLLAILPILTNLVIWTNPLHHWFRGQPYWSVQPGIFPVLVYDYRFWFYFIHAPVAYLYSFIAISISIRAIFEMHGIYRRQIILFLVALAFPIIADLAYVAGLSLIPHFNIAPIIFSFSGLLLAWNLFGFQFLDLLPLARDFVFDYIDEGIIILDNRQRIVDLNLAARHMIAVQQEMIGKKFSEVQDPLLEHLQKMIDSKLSVMNVEIEQSKKRFYELKTSAIFKNNRLSGQIIHIRDISEFTALYNQLHELAIRDSLTGVFTRRHFEELLQHSLHSLTRHPEYCISLLLLDIDHFKQVNDTFGHDGGDQAILALTQQCQIAIRITDVLARWGGDEFAILLEGANEEEAWQIAERVREAIGAISVSTPNGDIHISASIGLATSKDLPLVEMTIPNLFHLADVALYYAKEHGRDRWVAYAKISAPPEP